MGSASQRIVVDRNRNQTNAAGCFFHVAGLKKTRRTSPGRTTYQDFGRRYQDLLVLQLGQKAELMMGTGTNQSQCHARDTQGESRRTEKS